MMEVKDTEVRKKRVRMWEEEKLKEKELVDLPIIAHRKSFGDLPIVTMYRNIKE